MTAGKSQSTKSSTPNPTVKELLHFIQQSWKSFFKYLKKINEKVFLDSEVVVIGVLARYHLDSRPVSRLAADSGNASNA